MMWRSIVSTWQGMGQCRLRGRAILAVLLSLVVPASLLLAESPPTARDTSADLVEVIHLMPQQLQAGTAGELRIDLQFPEGYHLNPRAPLHYSIDVQGEGVHLAEAERGRDMIAPALPLLIPFQTSAGRHQSMAAIDMTFYYCRADDTGVCVIQSVRWQLPLHITPEQTTKQASISYKAEVPVLQKQL